jgi:LPS sulfotransferase NodH
VYSRKVERTLQKASHRTPTTRFAVLGYPRTGSSHLVSLLDSHPDIACWDDEIFGEEEAFDLSPYDSPSDFLCNVVFRIDAQAVGFKLLWHEMHRLEDVWTILKQLNIWLVHTYRKNLLDSFISYQLATLNRSFTSWHGDYLLKQLDVDFRECAEWFEDAEHCDAEIRRRSADEGIQRIEIEYNELCTTQNRILDFLRVTRCSLVSRLQKQRAGSQSEIIINYSEIKEKFANSKWAKYFVA